MEAATPALSDSTFEESGMRIRTPAALSISGARPAPSPPTKRAAGASRLTSDGRNTFTPATVRVVAAQILMPELRSCLISTDGEIPTSRGRRKLEPAEARKDLGDQGWAVPCVAMAPVAPKASAERMAVPLLPGSCTPARTRSIGGVGQKRLLREYEGGVASAA